MQKISDLSAGNINSEQSWASDNFLVSRQRKRQNFIELQWQENI